MEILLRNDKIRKLEAFINVTQIRKKKKNRAQENLPVYSFQQSTSLDWREKSKQNEKSSEFFPTVKAYHLEAIN
jgi:hypothetical protein